MSTPLTTIRGIGPAAAAILQSHGFDSAETVAATTIEKLSEVPGFGAIRAKTVIDAASEVVPAEPLVSKTKKTKIKKQDKVSKSKKSKKTKDKQVARKAAKKDKSKKKDNKKDKKSKHKKKDKKKKKKKK